MKNNPETKIISDLVAYLDGELSERDRRRVATALRGSPALLQEVGHLEQTGSYISKLDRATLSENFPATFLRRLKQVQQEEQIEQESLLARLQHKWVEWLAGGHWTPAFVPVASLLIILASFYSGKLLTSTPIGGSQLAQSDQIPAQVVENPVFFRDYWRTVRLERWAHFDEIARTPAPAHPNIHLTRENTPPKVIEDPNFFIQYQILRRMEQFQHFESVQNVQNINEEQV